MPIRILDAATVGRIAAGEVVERPSSVVKELIENAIDAQSSAITVEIRGGGIDYLRVTDNGIGIEPGQVRLAFENHATSKLQSADQLDDIRTLGFRGEALPSIASVSHVEMTTRARNQDTGVKLTIDGGENLTVREVGCPEGTTFIMKDLFYNLPVRHAFLKKPTYEGGLVGDAVARMIMGNPGVSVRYINNGNTVYHSFGDGKLRHAVFAVYGKQTAEQMIEVDASEGGARIHGLIGIGELAKSTRAHQSFFINGRAVRCALMSKALEEICKSRVTIGMYPMCALNLVIPPTSVNVNVHPNKLEVRFRDEIAMRTVAERLLSQAFEGEHVLQIGPEKPVEHTIEKVSTIREIVPAPKPVQEAMSFAAKPEEKVGRAEDRGEDSAPPVPDRPARPVETPRASAVERTPLPEKPSGEAPASQPVPNAGKTIAVPSEEAHSAPFKVSEIFFESAKPATSQSKPGDDEKVARDVNPYQQLVEEELNRLGGKTDPREQFELQLRERRTNAGSYRVRPGEDGYVTRKATAADEVNAFDSHANDEDKLPYRVIGVLMRTYILIEANDSLLMIDQHAAHERLQYEKYMAQLEAGMGAQQLLTPMVVHVSAKEMALIEENLPLLNEAGYSVEPFGASDIQVRSVPHILGKAEMRPAFMDTINALNRLRSATIETRRAEIMQMACKSAVKGGDPLSSREVHVLVKQMLETGAPPTCPHGRPVMKAISRRELEKMFKRIQ